MMIRRQFVLFALLSLTVGALCLLAADDKKGDEKKLPKCYLDITADGKKLGRIVVELRPDVVPKTAENFAPCVPAKKDSATKGARFIA